MFVDCFAHETARDFLDHDAKTFWFSLRRILWLQKPKEAIVDSYSASNFLYFGTSFVASSQLSTLASPRAL